MSSDPKETAGVVVRVREASGELFDSTFLRYQVSEQTRLRQITAEIFVREGLDSAINIDRESFNYSHPHFLYIQLWLHWALRLLVNRLKALADDDLKKHKKERALTQRQALQESAYLVWEKRLGESADPPIPENGAGELPDEIGTTEIEWNTKDTISNSDETMASAIAVVLEAYGVLFTLNPRDRANLITDLMNLLEKKWATKTKKRSRQ